MSKNKYFNLYKEIFADFNYKIIKTKHLFNKVSVTLSFEQLINLSTKHDNVFGDKYISGGNKVSFSVNADNANLFFENKEITELSENDKDKIFNLEFLLLFSKIYPFNNKKDLFDHLVQNDDILSDLSNTFSLHCSIQNKALIFIKEDNLWIDCSLIENELLCNSKNNKVIYSFIIDFKKKREEYFSKLSKLEEEIKHEFKLIKGY